MDVCLGSVIKQLKLLPENTVFTHGFHNAHSWRGSYCDVAFEPAPNITAGALLQSCEIVIDTTIESCGGGEEDITQYTEFHVAKKGHSSPYSAHIQFLAELMSHMHEPEKLFFYTE